MKATNKHGLFTYVVSDGLASSADLAKRGIITNDALTLFVRGALPSLPQISTGTSNIRRRRPMARLLPWRKQSDRSSHFNLVRANPAPTKVIRVDPKFAYAPGMAGLLGFAYCY